MLERNGRRLRRIESELDAKMTLSRFAGHVLHDGVDVAVLRPRKSVEAQARRLPVAHTPERGCGKLRNDLHFARRNDRRDSLALVNHRADLQGSDLGQPAFYGRADPTLVCLLHMASHDRLGRGPLSFERDAFAQEGAEMRLPLLARRGLFLSEALNPLAGRSEVGATTLCVGLRANDVGFSNESPSAQLTLAALLVVRLRDRCLRRCDALGSLRQRRARGATQRRNNLLLLDDLRRDNRQLVVQRRQSRALLIGFQRFAIGFDFEQHVAAPHAPAKRQIRGGDTAADRGAYGLHIPHLEARSRADFVNRDLAPQEPGAPDSEERSNEDEAEYGRPRAIGLERSQSVRERDGHGYRPSDEKRRGVSKNTAGVARLPGARSSLVGRAPGGVVSSTTDKRGARVRSRARTSGRTCHTDTIPL